MHTLKYALLLGSFHHRLWLCEACNPDLPPIALVFSTIDGFLADLVRHPLDFRTILTLYLSHFLEQ